MWELFLTFKIDSKYVRTYHKHCIEQCIECISLLVFRISQALNQMESILFRPTTQDQMEAILKQLGSMLHKQLLVRFERLSDVSYLCFIYF